MELIVHGILFIKVLDLLVSQTCYLSGGEMAFIVLNMWYISMGLKLGRINFKNNNPNNYHSEIVASLLLFPCVFHSAFCQHRTGVGGPLKSSSILSVCLQFLWDLWV